MAEKQSKNMTQKRERHFNETKTIISIVIMIIGACTCLCLVALWPQKFLVDVFQSRLAYHIVLRVEDFLTCNKDYYDFVIDEPDAESRMFMLYIYNISNAKAIYQRGYKPALVETGPYGFLKHSYKYDVSFHSAQSNSNIEGSNKYNTDYVTFKEYTLLREVNDSSLCEKMFFRMDRGNGIDTPCVDNACQCKSYDSVVSIINPLFLKTIWQDTSHDLIALYSPDVFQEIRSILDEPFTEAVRAHLVSNAYKEIYLFRVQMQVGTILTTSHYNLLVNHTAREIASTSLSPSSCGLSVYGINKCLFVGYSQYKIAIDTNSHDISNTSYPSLLPLLNSSNDFSFLNLSVGLPRYIGLAWKFGYVAFNAEFGYTTVTNGEFADMYNSMSVGYAKAYFNTENVNASMITGAKRMLKTVISFIGKEIINPYSVTSAVLQSLTRQEFIKTTENVACNPRGSPCLWQWGYMETIGANYTLSDNAAINLIDVSTEVVTNPNNIFKDQNAVAYYNSYQYCTNVYPDFNQTYLQCTNYEYTFHDGLVGKPAGLWGKDHGVSSVNLTLLQSKYALQSQHVKDYYFHASCNMSALLHVHYRQKTDFHDDYVIRYLNKYKDNNLKHNFTIGNWSELGLAQWGGGFITDALESVRSTNMLVRDGMWRIGLNERFYTYFMEFSSWAIRQGYPQAWLYTIEESKELLDALCRKDYAGLEFRRNIMYRSTTLLGDGKHYINKIGDVGEVAFTPENNRGNFTCYGELEGVCQLLNESFASAASYCYQINTIYDKCTYQYTFKDNLWINFDNCANFATTLTDATGIKCDTTAVFSQSHPYVKSRGNIIAQMMYALTYDIPLTDGLFCDDFATCTYDHGGLVATTTARKLLFNGYTEPSILKYYDAKYSLHGVSLECEKQPYDICGTKSYSCHQGSGIRLVLPKNKSLVLNYETTPYEEFFAPFFEVMLNS
eukprot:gene14212-19069_t